MTCNGVLFNNTHQSPVFNVYHKRKIVFNDIVGKMKKEIENIELSQYEMLISYMQIILITASRIKSQQLPFKTEKDAKEPEILYLLKNAIEENFKSKNLPAEYASMLNISQKSLAKIVKKYCHKTFTELITERILIETK